MRLSGRLRGWRRLLWIGLLGRFDQMDHGLDGGRSMLLFLPWLLGCMYRLCFFFAMNCIRWN